MINNFQLLKGLLQFDNEGDFYFIQLIQRKKDNPEIARNMNIINNYYVYSLEDYTKKIDRIIHECDAHNARAYLRVNVRNAKKVGMVMLKKVTDLIISEDYEALKSAYTAAAGDTHSQKYPRWIVDIDEKDPLVIHNVKAYIDYLLITFGSVGKTYCRWMDVPTKNGIHIITNPFRLDLFKQQFPTVDVHKDNPTILYIPSLW